MEMPARGRLFNEAVEILQADFAIDTAGRRSPTAQSRRRAGRRSEAPSARPGMCRAAQARVSSRGAAYPSRLACLSASLAVDPGADP